MMVQSARAQSQGARRGGGTGYAAGNLKTGARAQNSRARQDATAAALTR